jgi:hypothetical protein
MTPKDRALFQASIDFCSGQDPHKTWRRDDFIDYVMPDLGCRKRDHRGDHDRSSAVSPRHRTGIPRLVAAHN